MTAANPHPLANPLNQSRFKNYDFSRSGQQQPALTITHTSDAKNLTVPESTPWGEAAARMQSGSGLEVPNSDIPYFNGPVPASGFLGKTTMFKLADGSVLDLKTCKIVYDPSKKWKAQGYWDDPNAEVQSPKLDNEWGRTEPIDALVARVENPDGTYNDLSLDPKSIEYWKKANEESKKLEQSLTDEQKQLLADLQAGKMFPLSKLVDEK